MSRATIRASPTPSVDTVTRYHTLPEYIGDLIVNGDQRTMFGEMDSAFEELPPSYRAHGSLHEMTLPLIIYNASGAVPHPSQVRVNKDLSRFLFTA